MTVIGAEHALGGIHKPVGMPETPADRPEQVALVQQATTAFLCSALHRADDAWSHLEAALPVDTQPLGRLESK